MLLQLNFAPGQQNDQPSSVKPLTYKNCPLVQTIILKLTLGLCVKDNGLILNRSLMQPDSI